MRFSATIRKGSTLDKAWRGHNRLTAKMGDITFAKGPGGNLYTADGLTAEQVKVLRGDPNVVISVVGTAPSGGDPFADPGKAKAHPAASQTAPKATTKKG